MAKELPIIICTDLIPATMAGRKTVTRRVIRPQPEVFDNAGYPDYADLKPRYKKGDLLWVREGWRCTGGGTDRNIIYRSDGDTAISYCGIDDGRKSLLQTPKEYWDKWDYYVYESPIGCNWRPSIHMSKWMARTWLEVLDARAERLQEITPADCELEGLKLTTHPNLICGKYRRILGDFKDLWYSLNAKRGYPWESNPWVWRYEFKLINHAPRRVHGGEPNVVHRKS